MCGREKTISCRTNTRQEFIDNSISRFGDRFNYDKTVYTKQDQELIITCKVHGDLKLTPRAHFWTTYGCAKCDYEIPRARRFKIALERARKVHGDKYDYSKVVYRGNKKPVEIICPTHGSFFLKPNSHTSTRQGCGLCQESKGEIAVEVFLKKYSLDHVRQYKVQPHLFRYDFYLPELDIYIEFHGKQHYMPVDLFGGQLGFEKTKERDERKRDIVKEVGGTLIELSYLCLRDGSVEKELIARLKKVYVKWYLIDGKVKAFKTHQDVYNAFNIPKEVLVRFIDQEIMIRVNEFKILF